MKTIEKVDSKCFTRTGKRRKCKLMHFTNVGVLCNGKYLFCHVANLKECPDFEKETKSSKETKRKPILLVSIGKKGIGKGIDRSYSMKDAHQIKL